MLFYLLAMTRKASSTVDYLRWYFWYLCLHVEERGNRSTTYSCSVIFPLAFGIISLGVVSLGLSRVFVWFDYLGVRIIFMGVVQFGSLVSHLLCYSLDYLKGGVWENFSGHDDAFWWAVFGIIAYWYLEKDNFRVWSWIAFLVGRHFWRDWSARDKPDWLVLVEFYTISKVKFLSL